MSSELDEKSTTSLWTGRHGVATVGVFSLAFLFAFESYAVITALPVVADDLDGVSWYAIAFAAPLATSVVATAGGGAWCDRAGPLRPMLLGVVGFGIGLVLAGLAPSMPWFLAGRAVQGVGSGLAAVGLYVLIAKTFPAELRPRAFAVLTSAWTLPALVGPPVAGWIAHELGWRWVFLGVPLLAVLAFAVLLDPLRRAGTGTGETRPVALGSATLVAVGVLAVSVAGQRVVTWWPVVLALGLVAVVVGAPRLLPAGVWTGGRGLPSVLATRGLIAAAFFGAEAYLVLSLVEHRGMTPTVAGLVAGAAAFAWFGGAWSSAHLAALHDRRLRLRVASASVVVGTLAALVVPTVVPLAVVVLAWAVGGFGMGLGFSTMSVLVLELSASGEEGRNSASTQINDQITQATWLALGSVAFAALLPVDQDAAFSAVVGGSLLLALASFLPQRRIGVR